MLFRSFASGIKENYALPDDALSNFLDHCHNTIGQAYFQTPRNTIKAFLDLLAILEQNPEASWQGLLQTVCIDQDRGGMEKVEDISGDDELTTFRI